MEYHLLYQLNFILHLFCKYRRKQLLRNRFSHLTIIEVLFILSRFIANILIICSNLIGQHYKWRATATYIRQIAFHFCVFLDFCTVYTWVYRFWCIFFAMNWISAAYKHKWQKLVDASHGKSDNWYLCNKKTFGNYKFIKKYIICLVLISSAIVIPLRFSFDFAPDQYDYTGLTAHAALILIPQAFILFILIKLPKFEDFIYVRTEIRIICTILLLIYIIGLIASEIIEHLSMQTPQNQIKILIIYSVLKEFGNFCCLYVATGWVLRRFYSLIALENDTSSKQKRRQNAQKSYRPTITLTLPYGISARSPQSNAKSPISEDKTLLLDEMDVFDQLTAFPMHEFGKYSNDSDVHRIQSIQNKMGEIRLCDVLSHAHAFDTFMVHLSKEFSMECLLSYLEMAQYRNAVFSVMMDMKLMTGDCDIKRLPFNLPATVPQSSIVYSRPFNCGDTRYDFRQHIKRKAVLLFNKYIRVGAEYEINIASRLRKEITVLIGNCHKFMENDVTEKELLVIFDECCREMVVLMQDSFRRFVRTTQFLKLSDLIFDKRDSAMQTIVEPEIDPITPHYVN